MKAHPATLLTLIHCLILTIYAEYIAISITADDYQINQYTTYTFELQRYFNPLVFDFIDPVASIPLNSIIQLTFPSDFITISN